jgi:thiosulfate reductase cytochrome b subunit
LTTDSKEVVRREVYAHHPGVKIYRHHWPVRLMHWINAVCLALLLGSGLQIFNAHPSLSWGQTNTPQSTWLELTAVPEADGRPHGKTILFGHSISTDGVLGASNLEGEHVQRGFPSWATVPGQRSLAMGRRWHFFFGWLFVLNGAAYILWSVGSRHLTRDLVPDRNDWRNLGQSIKDHLRFRHTDDPGARYNVLQRLAYLGVIVAACAIVTMGLTLSPRLDAAFPWLVDLVGGRQSARSFHFLLACSLVAFVAVHLFEVLISGVVNQLRSMITGYVRVKDSHEPE